MWNDDLGVMYKGPDLDRLLSDAPVPADTSMPDYRDTELDDLVEGLEADEGYSFDYDDQWLQDQVEDWELDYDAEDSDDSDIQEAIESEWSEEYMELFDDTFEDYTDLVEDESIDQQRYMAVDQDNEIAIEYDVSFDGAADYPAISVVKHEMPDGLFGFTNTDEMTGKRSVHISDNLYRIDEESTIPHEKTHQRFPGKHELTIRYINGDVDPGNTLSLAHYSHVRSWSNDGLLEFNASCCGQQYRMN